MPPTLYLLRPLLSGTLIQTSNPGSQPNSLLSSASNPITHPKTDTFLALKPATLPTTWHPLYLPLKSKVIPFSPALPLTCLAQFLMRFSRARTRWPTCLYISLNATATLTRASPRYAYQKLETGLNSSTIGPDGAVSIVGPSLLLNIEWYKVTGREYAKKSVMGIGFGTRTKREVHGTGA
ncbi:hypothetical protein PGT21_034785 [Puccinia graminis f. sp. tritici]|uniref:Uncharacterized protein n=1 Tax=Puccinia graminis f. sp. tritici TaxID=56615 RepID=A0A5B0MIW1_PUCGR|nr:hypothetical protein PGTUg99_036079 [Puccinia graminis f. sp. tritici]KAA1091495.1 hypothetical protein PGT21_034785 [Puccinia graminis f. sp. tritici]